MCTQSKIFNEPEVFMSLELKILGKKCGSILTC